MFPCANYIRIIFLVKKCSGCFLGEKRHLVSDALTKEQQCLILSLLEGNVLLWIWTPVANLPSIRSASSYQQELAPWGFPKQGKRFLRIDKKNSLGKGEELPASFLVINYLFFTFGSFALSCWKLLAKSMNKRRSVKHVQHWVVRYVLRQLRDFFVVCFLSEHWY